MLMLAHSRFYTFRKSARPAVLTGNLTRRADIMQNMVDIGLQIA